VTTTERGRDEADPDGDGRAPSSPRAGAVVFAAQPASVSAARRFVRQALRGSAAALVDDAALVVTELVSNAVLHAGGPITLTTEVAGDGAVVRLEVGDSSPVPPALREYGSSASTGRGLTLVARLARRWGVEPADRGKTVWVELAVDDADREDTARISPPASSMPGPPAAAGGEVPVRFEGVPVPVYLRLQEQNDAVLRELELLAFTADHAGHLDPSPELVEVIERSRRYFNLTREGFQGAVNEAAERGETTIDLTGAASLASLVPSADLVGLFEQAEELARSGELLIGAADEDVARLRRWFVEELSAQLLGERPARPFST
jgi:anti-sigma regulatory factor (Ser/Thr protein kinase)